MSNEEAPSSELSRQMRVHENMKDWLDENASDILEEARDNGVDTSTIDLAREIATAFAVHPAKREPTEKVLTQKAGENMGDLDPKKYSRAELDKNPDLANLLHKLHLRAHEITGARQLPADVVTGLVDGISQGVTKNLKE